MKRAICFVMLAFGVMVSLGANCNGGGSSEQVDDPNLSNPRLCVEVDGRPVNVNAAEAHLVITGYRCVVHYDREGRETSRECGRGVLTLQPSADFPACVNVMDAANPDAPISYSWFHPCTGYFDGADSYLLDDTTVSLGSVPGGYCDNGVPQCSMQPSALWSQPYSDAGGWTFDGATVAECCQYPGASVQVICECPDVYLDCSIDPDGNLIPDQCACRDWIAPMNEEPTPGIAQCTVNTDDDGLYDDLCVCNGALVVCDLDLNSDGTNDHCACE